MTIENGNFEVVLSKSHEFLDFQCNVKRRAFMQRFRAPSRSKREQARSRSEAMQ
jgi:hypothetical protein